jgi:hypothetical protein
LPNFDALIGQSVASQTKARKKKKPSKIGFQIRVKLWHDAVMGSKDKQSREKKKPKKEVPKIPATRVIGKT